MKKIKVENQFFRLHCGSFSIKKYAAPVAPKDYDELGFPEKGLQTNWSPIIFKKLKEEGPVPDYVCTDICGRICSLKLRKIIDEHQTNSDNKIQWLPMIIEDEESGAQTEYYYLHFPEVCDSLDFNHTTFSLLGVVQKIAFSFSKIKNRSIFNCAGSAYCIGVSKKLKEAIFKSGCTGVTVSPANVVQKIKEKEIY